MRETRIYLVYTIDWNSVKIPDSPFGDAPPRALFLELECYPGQEITKNDIMDALENFYDYLMRPTSLRFRESSIEEKTSNEWFNALKYCRER